MLHYADCIGGGGGGLCLAVHPFSLFFFFSFDVLPTLPFVLLKKKKKAWSMSNFDVRYTESHLVKGNKHMKCQHTFISYGTRSGDKKKKFEKWKNGRV